MARLIIDNKCPLCGERVEMLPDHILKREPHKNNVEFVVTRAGRKQYFHTKCWIDMIAEKRPYTRKAMN